MKPEGVTKLGFVIGVIVWFIFTLMLVSSVLCLDNPAGCGFNDIILVSIAAVGFTAPSWFAAVLFSFRSNCEYHSFRSRVWIEIKSSWKAFAWLIPILFMAFVFSYDYIYST